MDKLKAAESIQRHRRRWRRPQESDASIAHRAERVYFRSAIIFAIIGIAEAWISLAFKRDFLFIAAAGFLIGAVIFYWHSRRFTQVLRLLPSEMIAKKARLN